MTTAGFGTLDWLPASVQRAREREDRQEAAAARREAAEREARAEQAHDRAVASFMAGASARGEDVTASDMMAGNIGRTIGEVLAGAAGELADRIPKAQRGERDYELILDGEVVQRSERQESGGWPSSEYELARMIEQAEENRRWLVAFRARTNYPEALERTRAQSTGAAERAAYNHYGDYPEIRR